MKVCNKSTYLTTPCDKNCLIPDDDRKWWYFLCTSLAIFLVGLAVIYSTRVLIRSCNLRKRKLGPSSKAKAKDKNGSREDPQPGLYLRIKEQAGTLLTAQTFKGRCFVIVSFLFNISYVALYIVESGYPVEHCLDLNAQVLWLFEIALNAFFVLHFILRFLAANDKMLFWCDPLSLVDFFTVPQVFVSIVIKQNWIGLRFLRAMIFIKLSDILQILGLVSSSSGSTLAKMLGNLLALLFAFGGLVHLLENTGDPWDFSVRQDWNYYECIYLLVVTMSTVGYGDYSPNTYVGRFIMMIFICIGLGIFATHIPYFMEYFASHTPYHATYKIAEGRKHIVICGHITQDTVDNFLRDFLHEDRSNINTNVVILGRTFPDPELERIIKKNFVHVSYFIGTVLSAEDCRRVKMLRADACLVLCNKSCASPDKEDEENIMRVVAVKNYHPEIRVIIQLLQFHNKSYLLNIPSWDPKLGDDVVCVGELKLGFIAQSCLSPGFSTLLANVFSMRSNESSTEQEDTWRTWYIRGTNCEMYTETLASTFKGMKFKQVAEICFEKLNLLLIAVEITKSDGEKTFAVNPSEKSMTIASNTRGYFLAGSSHEVKRALYYCQSCHSTITDPEMIRECDCSRLQRKQRRDPSVAASNKTFQPEDDNPNENTVALKATDDDNATRLSALNRIPNKNKGSYKVLSKLKAAVEEAKDTRATLLTPLPGSAAQSDQQQEESLREQQPVVGGDPAQIRFDVTGTFYWVAAKPFDEAILTREMASNVIFTHHILVCVFNKKEDPLVGLRKMVMPLRASNLHRSDLKKIVFLGDKDYMKLEWEEICNFHEVYILPGSPFCRADLRAVNANLADMVVFLSGTAVDQAGDPRLADKQSILASLNLKAMSFDDAIGLTRSDTRDAFIGLPDANFEKAKVERRGSAFGCNIPMITEIVYDRNVQYLDIDDDDDDDMELYLSQPFACGTTFTASVLDSLMSSTYFNGDILTLVRNLVTGGVNPILEEQLAEGDGLKGGYDFPETAEIRGRCKITQVSLYDGPLAQFGDGGLYGSMFLHALKFFSMICLGVYRFRDSNRSMMTAPSSKRYVIATPPYSFVLQPTDLVFVLAHSNEELDRVFAKE
ncbi:calcium-activated potassium channel subunit alpha-1 isoform X4 [Nematostella vectensis]|uniref:calcium-activated potassium channel subunit alpha-1 isoform X4 n=1 Tax=Nematostella vectensis TaxID=45351 RepID=UPI002077611F|nr:calcium-activated potassium channel subunit alpha-1 isoform X4 [Nematostella vectensis]